MLQQFVQGIVMSDTDLEFRLTPSHPQIEVPGVGLPLPFVRKFVFLGAWKNVRKSEGTLVMGIKSQYDVGVSLPQMIQHGF